MTTPHVCSSAAHPPLTTPGGGWQPVPAAGTAVKYRHRCMDATLDATVVLAVSVDDSHDDANVWGWQDDGTGIPQYEPLPDPRPLVTIEVQIGAETDVIETRQIRHTGSPGWAYPGQEG